MVWRGSTTIADRIFACLPYLLPIIDGLAFGGFWFSQFPILQLLLLPLQPVLAIYASLGQLGQLLVFFALFVFVVRNEKISHFIRFNAMQAILLDVVIFLCKILVQILTQVPNIVFATQTLANIIFIAVVGVVAYAVAQSSLGRYAEIPTISDAVYTQIR